MAIPETQLEIASAHSQAHPDKKSGRACLPANASFCLPEKTKLGQC